MKRKMTATELKLQVESTGSYFFTRSAMKFFGDTMANYGVRANTVRIVAYSGVEHDCWELYRRKPVKSGIITPMVRNDSDLAYFDVGTFQRIRPRKDNPTDEA